MTVVKTSSLDDSGQDFILDDSGQDLIQDDDSGQDLIPG